MKIFDLNNDTKKQSRIISSFPEKLKVSYIKTLKKGGFMNIKSNLLINKSYLGKSIDQLQINEDCIIPTVIRLLVVCLQDNYNDK